MCVWEQWGWEGATAVPFQLSSISQALFRITATGPKAHPSIEYLLCWQGLIQHFHIRMLREVVEFTQVRDDPLQMLQELGWGDIKYVFPTTIWIAV